MVYKFEDCVEKVGTQTRSKCCLNRFSNRAHFTQAVITYLRNTKQSLVP